jgi:hypothetical protein
LPQPVEGSDWYLQTTQAFKPLWDRFGDLPSISFGGVVKKECVSSKVKKIVRWVKAYPARGSARILAMEWSSDFESLFCLLKFSMFERGTKTITDLDFPED